MATTTAAWITSIVTTLSVTGVTRKYIQPPQNLNTADLPASFPKGFRRSQSPMTFQTHGGWPTHELDFFIACEPVVQSRQPENYLLIQTMADNLDAAIRAALPNVISKSPLSWEIRAGDLIIEVAGIAYWAVMATITGKG